MKFQAYQDKQGAWRWRLRHHNGNILAMSSEGYTSWEGCLKCIGHVKNSADTPVEGGPAA